MVVIVDAVVGNDEQFAVFIHQVGKQILDVVVKVGGDVRHQVNQSASGDQLFSTVGAIEQIGVVFTGDLGAQGLIQVAGKELDLKLDTEFFFDQFVHLVVVRGLVAGIAAEHGDRDGLLSQREGRHGQDHRQSQDSSQQFTHVSLLHLCNFFREFSLPLVIFIIDACVYVYNPFSSKI